jgi:beta-phosphoglucomutase-like phosphatase (HAD superfamily)
MDVAGAHAAGMLCVGFSNRAQKASHLAEAEADAVIGPDGMFKLAELLQRRLSR